MTALLSIMQSIRLFLIIHVTQKDYIHLVRTFRRFSFLENLIIFRLKLDMVRTLSTANSASPS